MVIAMNVFASEPSTFDILPGKLHKGGSLIAEAIPTQAKETINIKMDYEIIKRGYVPVPSHYLKGVHYQPLDSKFLDESGYLELETLGSMDIGEAKILHLGRIQYNEHSDAHYIHILPHNGKSELFLVYHPTIQGLGWDNLRLILHTDAPILRDYLIEGKQTI